LIVSDNYSTGLPHNFDRINQDGTQAPFSSASGFRDEVYMAAVRPGQTGGWTVGDLYTGTGVGGQIAKISNNGNTVTNPWVTLSGETGLLRGALTFDQTGVFGGDLIVVTTVGGI
jgi:hypothetical protein